MGTDFLFASPSFAEGWGRAVDFGGTLTEYNSALTPRQADFLALYSDWLMVGRDIRRAAKKVYAEDGEQTVTEASV